MGTDVRIHIHVSVNPITTTFGKEVHLEDMTQIRLMMQVLVASSRQYHLTN